MLLKWCDVEVSGRIWSCLYPICGAELSFLSVHGFSCHLAQEGSQFTATTQKLYCCIECRRLTALPHATTTITVRSFMLQEESEEDSTKFLTARAHTTALWVVIFPSGKKKSRWTRRFFCLLTCIWRGSSDRITLLWSCLGVTDCTTSQNLYAYAAVPVQQCCEELCVVGTCWAKDLRWIAPILICL